MKLMYSKHFLRTLGKLAIENQQLVIQALTILAAQPNHPSLHIHVLQGKHRGKHSITVKRDLRVLFQCEGSVALLLTVGSHDELY